MPPSIHLRAALPDDLAFLRRLYADTRRAEVAAFGWNEAQAEAFLDMQFDMQRRAYAGNYPEADHTIVEVDGHPVGRLLVNRTATEFRLVDIAFLTDARGGGIGTRLLADLAAEADAANVPVRLSVLVGNPAIRLYRRAGFEEIGGDGMYVEMERQKRMKDEG